MTMTMRQTVSVLMIVGLIGASLPAGPTAPVTVEGQATFQQEGANWTITTATDKTVISWGSFGVDAGAQVLFVQPNAASSVLNRVLGPEASIINGLLASNGGVYLFNPNGIVIGPGGVVRVADFVASTLDVSNSEFLAGKDINLKGLSAASIENYGKIEAIGGDVYLIARQVVNKGTVAASTGSANLVAATDVLLTQDRRLFVRPSLAAGGEGVGVDNSGVIDAVVARLQAEGNMYALAINNTGVVRATGSSIADGRVVLRGDDGSVVNGGYLAARTVGADGRSVGGEVQILGKDIAVTDGAVIDASGDLGGGKVLIGGDYQGANSATVPHAANTNLESGAAVAANALVQGNGGTVVVWSDGNTEVHGAISALGAGGGTGGLVETSGQSVSLSGLDLSCGDGGTWVLDPPPANWTVDATDAALIVAALNANTNVTRTAGGNIIVAADIIAAPSGSPYLFLNSGAQTQINADIDIGSAMLAILAGGGVTQTPGTSLVADQLWLMGNGHFTLDQPGNDFGTVAFQVGGPDNFVTIQDVNDLRIGTVGSLSGIAALGGEIYLFTPNGHILANALFPAAAVTAYRSLGNAVITETSLQSDKFEIRISNQVPYGVTPDQIETFLGYAPGTLAALTPNVNTMGSAVWMGFGDLAGQSMSYQWNFRTAETFSANSANDYSFVAIHPVGVGTPEVLADVEAARTAAKQDFGMFSWQTGWASDSRILNGVDVYTLEFGTMHVNHLEYVSSLYLRDILFVGGPIEGFVFDRIFDHVEDFPHVRPNVLASGTGNQILKPMLDEVSAYFDQASQGIFYDPDTSAVDPRYYYQSVGSIYQIPR